MYIITLFLLLYITIGVLLVKTINTAKGIKTLKAKNLSKSLLTGLLFAPTLIIVPAGHSAGVWPGPALFALYIGIESGYNAYVVIYGLMPILVTSIVAYIFFHLKTRPANAKQI